MSFSNDWDTMSREDSSDLFLDNCRICRYEGTDADPLSHPCKCNGSIKYVHQSCLVKWLLKTNKRYCELCRVPFTFSKVYADDTPRSLPYTILFQKLINHTVRRCITWIRFVFVFLVWLVLLPWSIRIFWRLLFWLADGGWTREIHIFSSHLSNMSNSTSNTTEATDISASLSSLNQLTTSLPLTRALPLLPLLRRIFGFYSAQPSHSHNTTDLLTTSSALNSSISKAIHKQSWKSLLSDVTFFRQLSDHPSWNRMFLDIVEGQIIAIFIVVSFVLIFLIREWVVQQLPLTDLELPELAQDGIEVNLIADELDLRLDNPEADELDQDDFDDVDEGSVIASDLESIAGSGFDFDNEGPLEQLKEISIDGDVSGSNIWTGDAHMGSSSIGTTKPKITVRNLAQSLPALVRSSILDADESLFHTAVSSSQLADPTLEKRLQFLSALSKGYTSRILDGPLDTETAIFQAYLEDDAFEDPPRSAYRLLDSLFPSTLKGKEVIGHENEALNFLSIHRIVSAIVPKIEREGEFLLGDSHTPPHSLQSRRSSIETWGSSEEPGSPEPINKFDEPEVRANFMPHHDIPSDRPQSLIETEMEDHDVQTPPPDVLPEPGQINGEQAPQPLVNQVLNWFWGEVRQPQVDPDLPNQADGNDNAGAAIPVDEVAEIDGGDEIEDLEGIFELLGLQGPILGLFQNSIFSLILISATIIAAVWFPYLWGKLVLLLIGGSSPWAILRMPFELASVVADIVFDITLGCVSFIGFVHLRVLRYVCGLLFFWVSTIRIGPLALDDLAASSKSLFLDSTNRLLDFAGIVAVDSDYLKLSVHSHAALRSIESKISMTAYSTVGALCTSYDQALNVSPAQLLRLPVVLSNSILSSASSFGTYFYQKAGSLTVGLSNAFVFDYRRRSEPFSTGVREGLNVSDPALMYWSSTDRAIAIFAGYLTFVLIGGLYLYRAQTKPLTSSIQARKIERILYQTLRQAGGVLKVMVIIGIEMIIFPLYCGSLLDFALLPLFENATVASRVVYALKSPWTAGFVHWFIGTSYMFHFALFVSMCRKILRKGVLHFIRDPDDPSNHPVRDVLERNVATQLRKIMFSAFIYGGLVLVCLGGVVWSIALMTDSILPLRSGRRNSLLESVFDLVVFGFLTPIVLDGIQPSDALNTMYTWWFYISAKWLRLSSFLLGQSSLLDRRPQRFSWPFGQRAPPPRSPGQYVFAPASDQVRLAKGEPVFKEVLPNNRMSTEHVPYPNLSTNSQGMYRRVYIPPLFWTRICIFVTWLWIFSVLAGMAVSVLPLVCGRATLAVISRRDPKDINDIYSFVTGLYIFGLIDHGAKWLYKNHATLRASLRDNIPTPARLTGFVKDVLSFLYVYFTLTVFLPIALTTVFEIYFLLPLHYMFQPTDRHSIHLIQNWTLGILYVRLAHQFIDKHPNMFVSKVVRAIFEQGWYRPKASLATRSLIIPLVLIFTTILCAPWAIATLFNVLILTEVNTEDSKSFIYRIIYPACALCWINGAILLASRSYFRLWQQSVIDEIYVVREQLHNFGEQAPDTRTPDVPTITS